MNTSLALRRRLFALGFVISSLSVTACGGGVYVAPHGTPGAGSGASPSATATGASTPVLGATPTPAATLAPGSTPTPLQSATPTASGQPSAPVTATPIATSVPIPTSTPSPAVSPLYVVDGGSKIEVRDPLGGSLLATIAGAATQLKGAVDVATDNAGNIYAIDNVALAIFEYPKGANGNVAPIRTITLISGSVPKSLAIDTANDIFALVSGEVDEYDPGSTTSDGPYDFFAPSGSAFIRLDGSGDIYVAGVSSIEEYTPGIVNSANGNEKRTLTDANASNQAPITGLAVDQQGNIALAIGSGEVHYFTAAQTGTASAAVTYTNLVSPEGIAFDAAGDIFVGSFGSTSHPVTVFDATTGARRTFSLDTDVQNMTF